MGVKLSEKEDRLEKIIKEDIARTKRAKDVTNNILMSPIDGKVSLCFNFSIGGNRCSATIRANRDIAEGVLKYIESWSISDKSMVEGGFKVY